MTKTVSALSLSAILLGALLDAGAAGATTLIQHSFVSSTGLDGNPCTRSQPCADYQTAYNATVAGGIVDTLGEGDYGSVTITHAITIDGEGVGTILASAADGIDISAGNNDGVVLRRLIINGAGASNTGVKFTSGGALIVDNCNISLFTANPAIAFSPADGGNGASLWVANSQFIHDGAASSASILISDGGGAGEIKAHIYNDSILAAIGNGIRIDGSGAMAPFEVAITAVTVDQASGGSAIVAVSGASTVTVLADGTSVLSNKGYGFRAVGAGASLLLSHSNIFNDGVGVGASSGGSALSYGDNNFGDNGSDGATLGSISKK
jgi:hypothetical protein